MSDLRQENTAPVLTCRGSWLEWMSLATNFALAGLLVVLGMPHLETPGPIQGVAPAPPSRRSTPIPSRERSRVSSNRTVWADIVAEDPTRYAANLRRIGCPEPTICDILKPAIHRLYIARIQQTNDSGDFWATGARRAELRRAVAASRHRLWAEEARLLTDLACAEDDPAPFFDGLTDDFADSFLDSSTRASLRRLFQDYQRRVLHWKEQTDQILLPEERLALLRERDEFSHRLNQLLTPEQREEFRSRSVALGRNPDQEERDLGNLHLTPAEYRGICQIRQGADEHGHGFWTSFNELLDDSVAPPKPAAVNAAIRDLLGEYRFVQYTRNTEPLRPAAEQLIAEFGQPSEMVWQIADELIAWRADAATIHANWGADPNVAKALILEHRDVFRSRLAPLLAAIPSSRREAILTEWTDEVIHAEWRQP